MIQPRDAILDGVPRGQHQNGHALPCFAKLAAHRETVRRGNHHVEDDEVVRVHCRLIKRIFARARDIHRIRLFTQPFSDESRDPRIIFHQEKPHKSIIRQKEGE